MTGWWRRDHRPETVISRYHASAVWYIEAVPQWNYSTADAAAAEAARLGYRPVIVARCCGRRP